MRSLIDIICFETIDKLKDSSHEEKIVEQDISPYSMINLLVYCESLRIIDGLASRENVKRVAAELFSKMSSHSLSRIIMKSSESVKADNTDPFRGLIRLNLLGLSDLSKSFEVSGLKLIIRRYRAVQRVIYGASSGVGRNLFEIGLEVDPLYGIPLIRGSGIKGAVRWCAETELEYFMRNKNSIKDTANIKDLEEFRKTISVLFGCSKEDKQLFESCKNVPAGSVGAALFLDAYPIDNTLGLPIVIPDVITPHYMREGKEILDEAEVRPNPLVHISISFGTVFVFPIVIDVLRLKANGMMSEDKAENNLDRWLQCALEEIGVGLRTSVGYGVFKLHREKGEARP